MLRNPITITIFFHKTLIYQQNLQQQCGHIASSTYCNKQ